MYSLRQIITLLLIAVALFAHPQAHASDALNLLNVPVKDIDGKETSLGAYKGKVLLIVNVASQCGYTSQYEGLEALWRRMKDSGLVVLGFPTNDFGGQEPGTEAEIKAFCTSRFDVTFPMFEKIQVKGQEQHPLYAALTGPSSPVPGPVKWNFGKFLVGRNGKVIARYGSGVEPDSDELLQAITTALASKP